MRSDFLRIRIIDFQKKYLDVPIIAYRFLEF